MCHLVCKVFGFGCGLSPDDALPGTVQFCCEACGQQREIRWCFVILEVVSSVVAGGVVVVLLMLILLLWHQWLRPQYLLPVGGPVGVWH